MFQCSVSTSLWKSSTDVEFPHIIFQTSFECKNSPVWVWRHSMQREVFSDLSSGAWPDFVICAWSPGFCKIRLKLSPARQSGNTLKSDPSLTVNSLLDNHLLPPFFHHKLSFLGYFDWITSNFPWAHSLSRRCFRVQRILIEFQQRFVLGQWSITSTINTLKF